jgi:putative transposase
VHKHLRRLERVWVELPIYFVTTCAYQRLPILARDDVAQILIDGWCGAKERYGWTIGRYIIMPDHVHFFCAPELETKTLPQFVGAWKSWTSRRIRKLHGPRSTTLWQREFFDHVLRSSESYSEKWDYVRENPVRTRLVESADEWKYGGEIELLML